MRPWDLRRDGKYDRTFDSGDQCSVLRVTYAEIQADVSADNKKALQRFWNLSWSATFAFSVVLAQPVTSHQTLLAQNSFYARIRVLLPAVMRPAASERMNHKIAKLKCLTDHPIRLGPALDRLEDYGFGRGRTTLDRTGRRSMDDAVFVDYWQDRLGWKLAIGNVEVIVVEELINHRFRRLHRSSALHVVIQPQTNQKGTPYAHPSRIIPKPSIKSESF
ncbi:hypothetical protein K458DRAFT_436058 [Lentithecium fluviatile CBS 122367]|uniref:Uncharacterized protein n=1 Tax=Lentithecium fluviatile CBS 122367 TaxID=1168545 RepID=A0A6G1IIT4_9PLEO|nr:hypothetical protein K458DRAFT_436058 [Lentithecium fluviatile CBS 122367]